jgi:hypothetical protein
VADLTRLDARDGAWVTFRTTFGWGAKTRIEATLLDGDGSEAFMRALVRETVTGWHVPTDAGGWVDWTPTDEAPKVPDDHMEQVDAYVGDQVLQRCSAIWNQWRKGRPDPKDTEPSSDATPLA